MDAVWIVQHDDTPHNTVLGVFSTEQEAAAFAEESKAEFQGGLIYARFPIGYRYDNTAGHVTFGPTS